MTRPTCDECTRLATGLCEHDNPICDVCECSCESTFSLAVDVAPDGTSTVAYTPPGRETEDGWPRCPICGEYADYCRNTCSPANPTVRDALHLVGLDLPREA